MKRLWIIGNSGAARECYWIYRDMCAASTSLEREISFAGFLGWDHYPSKLASLSSFFRGEALEMPLISDDLFSIGIGAPALRDKIYHEMKSRGASFFTLLHPTADINPTASIGEANIFQRGSTVFCDARLGNANYLNGAVNLSHDVTVGESNFFGPFSLVLGKATVGSRNSFAVRATLLPHARIGDDNILEPGAIVYRGCSSSRRLEGNPAIIRDFCPSSSRASNK